MELSLHVFLTVTTLIIQHGGAQPNRGVGPQETPTTVQATTDAPHEHGAGVQVHSEDDFNKHWQNVMGDKGNAYQIMELNSLEFEKLLSNLNQKQEDEVDTKTKIKEDTVKEEFAEKDIVDTEEDKDVAGKVTPEGGNSKGVVENDILREIHVENNIVKKVETEIVTEENAKDTTWEKDNDLKEISQGSKVTKDYEEEQTVKEEREEKDIVKEEREEKDIVKEESEEKINTGALGKMAKAENIVKEKEEDDFVTETLEKEDVVKEQAEEGGKVSTINKVEHTTEEMKSVKETEETRVVDTEPKASPTEGVKTSEAKPSGPTAVPNVGQRSEPQEKVAQGEDQSQRVIPVGLVRMGYNDDTASSQDKPAGVGQIIFTTATLPGVDGKAPASRKVREPRIDAPSSKVMYPPSWDRSYYDVDRIHPPGWRSNADTPPSKVMYPPSWGRSYYDVDRTPPPGWRSNTDTPSSKVMYPPSWGRSYYDVDRTPPPGWRPDVVGNEGPTFKPTSRMLFGALPPNKQRYNYPNQLSMSAWQGQNVMNKLFPQPLPASPSGLEKTLSEKDPDSKNSKGVAQGISTRAGKESSSQAVETTPEKTSPKVQPSGTKGDDKVDVDQKLEAQSSSWYLNRGPSVDGYSQQSTYLQQTSQPGFPGLPLGGIIYPVFLPIPVYPLPPPCYRAQSGIPPPPPKPRFPYSLPTSLPSPQQPYPSRPNQPVVEQCDENYLDKNGNCIMN